MIKVEIPQNSARLSESFPKSKNRTNLNEWKPQTGKSAIFGGRVVTAGGKSFFRCLRLIFATPFQCGVHFSIWPPARNDAILLPTETRTALNAKSNQPISRLNRVSKNRYSSNRINNFQVVQVQDLLQIKIGE